MPQDQYELTIKTFREYARKEIDNHLSELNTSYQDRALDSGDLKHEGFEQHHKILENELKEKIQELASQKDNWLKIELEKIKNEYLDNFDSKENI